MRESITQGMELVFARENWTVAGRKVEMIREDDEMKPPVGIRKTEKLIDSDNVDILTGPVHSGILMGMRDKVHNSKTILIVSNAGADAISRERCSTGIFRTSFSNWQPNQPMGEWVAKHVSKDVFIAAPNYQAGKDQLGAFKETFVPAGGKLVGEDYPKLGETDYAPYLTKIKQSGAKAVYAFFSGTDAVNFVKQYDDFGLKQSIKLTGAGFLTEPDVLPAQGKSALGVITGHFYTPQRDSPTNRKFVADFKAKFANKTPDGFACQGYDTAEVIVRALKAVNGNTKDKDKLVDAIARVEFDSPRGRFRFDPKTHNVIQPFIYVREVKEVSGGLDNVPIDKIANVTDPGTGCTLPAGWRWGAVGRRRSRRVRARLLRPGPEWAVIRRPALSPLGRSHAHLRHARRGQPRSRVVLHARRLRRPRHDWGHRELLARPRRRAARGGRDRRRHGAARAAPALRALAAGPGAPHVRVHLPLRGPREVDLGWTHPLHPTPRSLLTLGEDLWGHGALLPSVRHRLRPRGGAPALAADRAHAPGLGHPRRRLRRRDGRRPRHQHSPRLHLGLRVRRRARGALRRDRGTDPVSVAADGRRHPDPGPHRRCGRRPGKPQGLTGGQPHHRAGRNVREGLAARGVDADDLCRHGAGRPDRKS